MCRSIFDVYVRARVRHFVAYFIPFDELFEFYVVVHTYIEDSVFHRCIVAFCCVKHNRKCDRVTGHITKESCDARRIVCFLNIDLMLVSVTNVGPCFVKWVFVVGCNHDDPIVGVVSRIK